MLPAIGVAIRRENRIVFDDESLNALEITFERADDPLRTYRYIGETRDFDYVSVHGLKLSVGSPDEPSKHYMDMMLDVAQENGAVSLSDHLGFTRDSNQGTEMGHFALVPLTEPALDVVCRNVEIAMAHFAPLHFFIENIAYVCKFGGTLEEADFISRMLDRTGVGWLLDVTNVYANSTNYNYDPYEFIRRVAPHASRVQMHLAGGYFDKEVDMYLDSHSHPIPDPIWDLYKFAIEQNKGKVDCVFIERDQNFPEEAEWRAELKKMRQIAEQVEGVGSVEVSQ